MNRIVIIAIAALMIAYFVMRKKASAAINSASCPDCINGNPPMVLTPQTGTIELGTFTGILNNTNQSQISGQPYTMSASQNIQNNVQQAQNLGYVYSDKLGKYVPEGINKPY